MKGQSKEPQWRIGQTTHGTDMYSSITFHLHAIPRILCCHDGMRWYVSLGLGGVNGDVTQKALIRSRSGQGVRTHGHTHLPSWSMFSLPGTISVGLVAVGLV